MDTTPDSSAPDGSALDEALYKRRVRTRLLASPWTLGPVVAGTTLLLGLWTFSIDSGIAVFGGIASVLGGVGLFLTRLFMGTGGVEKQVLSDLQDEARMERDKRLDQLEKRLLADGDPRTESNLRDLRALVLAFHKQQALQEGINTRSRLDILVGVEQLFKRCVFSLEKALELWSTAQQTVTREARQPILAQRERMIQDVAKSISQLSKILAGIQDIGAGAGVRDSDLQRIREELDQSLEVARAVEKRMRSLDGEIGDSPRLGP